MATSPSSSSSTSFSNSPPQTSNLPLKPVPGDYGLPFFGPIKDRLDYFYFQGLEKFFQTRVDKHKSTVFKTNMPPGPFNARNPKVTALLDAISFPVLFDMSKVEKRNILDGTFFPSVSFTGGFRMCAYLDPSEPNHASLKAFIMSLLANKHEKFIPIFRTSLSELFTKLEDEMHVKNEAFFNTLSDNMSFNYVFRLFCDKSPVDTKLGKEGPGIVDKWLFLQLAPLITLGLPKFLNFLEDFLLHTFPLPFFLVKLDYKKLYDVFYEFSASHLEKAEGFGLKREEACHNLVFVAGFNAYGGMKTLFPALIKWVGLAGEKLHRQLADEIRTIVSQENGEVSLSSLEKMSLTKSVVYEALRIEPPVPFQYGKAKEDLVIHSHEAAFTIKKGEMLFGYQPFATKDPRIFENSEEFVANRFVGDEGEKLLKYVFWSNGHETDDPSFYNKQCPAKDLVVLLCRVMLVEFFLRYDTFEVEAGNILLGSSVTFKSLTTKSTTLHHD